MNWMVKERLPNKESLIKTLRFLIDIHPIRQIRPVSLLFIYMGLHELYPDIVSYTQLNHISKRKRTPEQIAEAILMIRQRQEAES